MEAIDDRAAGATIGGRAIPDLPDLRRMRSERFERLQHQLEARGVDGLVLLGSSSVAYATGAAAPAQDGDRAALFRPVAVVVKGDSAPHLYTLYADGAPAELPDDHLHGPLFPDLDDGIDIFAAALTDHFPSGARVGVDDQTHAMLRGGPRFDWVDASDVIGAAKLTKTPDEIACIREAQRLNELAMTDALAILRPGVRQIDLSAAFLRRVFELGASANGIDPIWQVMAPSRELGPWTLHGDLAYPTVTTDRFLREGDVIWVDSGITWEGYASDYGRTWITSSDPVPNDKQQAQFRRWRAIVDAALEVLKPGVSALELGTTAIDANDGVRPWIEHFYLAHGVGTESAEMPLIGTDLGEGFDERLIMSPGMVLVLEPVIWEDGFAGYRSEDIVAVTDTGWVKLSGSTYEPYGLTGEHPKTTTSEDRSEERARTGARRSRGMSPVARDRGLFVGVMGLEDDARVDFALLRAERRAKVFSGMESHDLDVLMLGGVGDVRYVSGARQLGRSGVLPFAPVAVVVRKTARVHLLSTWDEGVPPEIGRDDLYRMSWNPANLAADLAKTPGVREARRVGTDGLTPMFAGLIPQLVTPAELVDAAPVMASARRSKTPEEIICLDVASAIAEAALTAMDDALAPGITERELLGIYDERIASLGTPMPPSESVCFATPSRGPVRFRHLPSDRPIGDGELVVLAPGALYAGYEAGLARTRVAGIAAPPGAVELASRCARGIDALIAACRPSNTGADLYRAWENAGNPDLGIPLAHGLGLGAEPPLIGLGRGRDATIDEGMVLSVQSWVVDEGVGGCLERGTVRIEGSEPVVLTRYGRL